MCVGGGVLLSFSFYYIFCYIYYCWFFVLFCSKKIFFLGFAFVCVCCFRLSECIGNLYWHTTMRLNLSSALFHFGFCSSFARTHTRTHLRARTHSHPTTEARTHTYTHSHRHRHTHAHAQSKGHIFLSTCVRTCGGGGGVRVEGENG